MRLLVLASYDSFLNAGQLIASYFREAGFEVQYALVKARKTPQFSNDQIAGYNLDPPANWVDLELLCNSGEINQYDILLSCLEGASTRWLVHHLSGLGEKRPLVISVYPGLVLRYPFDGYSMRAASDLVWLNCRSDREAFVEMCQAFGFRGDNARIFGVAPLLRRIARDGNANKGPVVFFEQTIIPRYQDERLFLAEQLCLLAKRFPGQTFLIRPRASGQNKTLHRAWHPIEDMLEITARRHGGWPENLKLNMEPASILLERASHCLTISSTVAVEAIYAGIPTTVLGDFGAHEDYGLSYFFASGMIRSFKEIDLLADKKPDADWMASHVTDPKETIVELVQEAISMAKLPRQPINDNHLRAEFSPELRNYLWKHNSVSRVISRDYRTRSTSLFRRLLGALRL